ncbi:A disintegrin and metalloproteinase with thrombospondin motifs 12 [Chironomus tepperi]|uniref:A disintegrin and metalloproteinase with thrombospondin motifs 12 n=1 Tax=Chironomus tepperi TaxID=113505 RepID=UPI00391EF18A
MLLITICVIKFILCASTTKALVEHEGFYSNKLSDAHLTVPRKVNSFGDHLSHDLRHHHEHNHYNDSTGEPDDHAVHYHVDIHNETLHLELEPSTRFVAPLMVVERHKRDLRTQHKRPQRHTQCHYQGKVRGHENSHVAISACNGLSGYIRTNKNEYLIEPSKNHKISENGHPHVIFHRSAVKNNNNNEVEKKGTQKKRRKRKKRHHSSNCGTREPRRLSETKIEWQPQGKVIVQGGRKVRNHHNQHQQKNKNHQKNTKKRHTRSVVTPRHVEALVVADQTMVQFHEGSDVDVEAYLLTIMNMVSALYKDPTIGNSIQVVVVKIILLDEEESYQDLNVTHVAQTTLDSFCRWQRSLNPKQDEDPHHHDVAILVTRKDLCAASGCSTLGVANVAGMCRADRSCSVNEDNGITLAHTITHELGHNFGMYHDTLKTGCDKRSGSILHIMTPSFEIDTVQVSWSNCSRRDITHFLDQGLGKCLEDAPSETEYTYPDLPPGAMYNADLQCRLQFNTTDEDIKMCSQLDEICSQLWCMINGTCTTLLRPAAPGTRCGKHKWCQDQKCVDIEDLPAPVEGGWGNWSEWGPCSRACGAGISIQTRSCDHPAPAFGGEFCIGERARYKTCNIAKCPDDEPSFRAQQCSKKNSVPIKDRYFTWLPYLDIHEPCKLYCTDKEDTFIQAFENVADGTPCKIGTNDMCISGICKRIGCDWIVDSNTTEDQCGVCGGTGETCTTVKGEFTEKINVSDGYYEIHLVPSGSRHISIEEMGPSKNYIAIGKADSKNFYLNGDRLIEMPGEYNIAGSVGLYEREAELEKMIIPGPIKYDIAIYIIFRGKQKNLGIKYEYTLPSNSTDENIFYWKLSDFTPCSKTCGGGIQYRHAVCYKRYEGIVEDKYCWSNAENKKPEAVNRTCNDESCPADWWIGPWQPCSVTCQRIGDKHKPMKRRTILCIDHNEIALPADQCDENTRPHEVEQCSVVLPQCHIDDNIHNDLSFNHDYDDKYSDNEIPYEF